MTGFARTEGELGETRWVCEARSLNGRGLDLRCRLPLGFEGLEPAIRSLATQRFGRGTLQVTLSFAARASTGELRLNRAALDQVLDIARMLENVPGVAPARLDGLLMIKGVIETAEPTETEAVRAGREAALLNGIAMAFDRLLSARKAEGRALTGILTAQINRIASLAKEARASAARAPETIKAKLKRDVEALLEASRNFDPDRLAQEAALLATKADIAEELDRLDAHVEQARVLLESAEPVGRKFEFLTQEFNREANTLCSKSSAIELTRTGLELKTVIDQLREQIQNVE